MKSNLTFVYFLLTTALVSFVGSPVLAFSNPVADETVKEDSFDFNSQDEGSLFWQELIVFDSEIIIEHRTKSLNGHTFLPITADHFVRNQQAISYKTRQPLDLRQRLSKYLHPFQFFW